MSTYTTHNFNGRLYGIERGNDGFYAIVREDGQPLGCAAAFHGAIDACVCDAYPREPRQTLRARPD